MYAKQILPKSTDGFILLSKERGLVSRIALRLEFYILSVFHHKRKSHSLQSVICLLNGYLGIKKCNIQSIGVLKKKSHFINILKRPFFTKFKHGMNTFYLIFSLRIVVRPFTVFELITSLTYIRIHLPLNL